MISQQVKVINNITSSEALKAGIITFEEVLNQKSRGRCGQEQGKPKWGGFLGENSASLAATSIPPVMMDTPSTWWTEDFVDLTSFTTTVVDERGINQSSSATGESDVPAMKMDEINSLMDVPTFAWLEEDDKSGVESLTPSPGTNSGKLYPPQGGKVTSLNFRKPANNSLVGRRDAQLKLDLTLAAEPLASSDSPSSFVQTSQVPAQKKELNMTTPDILGPLTDKNSSFNLLAYVFEEDKYPTDVDGKTTNVLNTPEIKPEQLDIQPLFTPKAEEPLLAPLIAIKEEPEEVEVPNVSPKESKEIKTNAPVKEEKKRRAPPARRRPSRPKEKVAVVEPRIKIELDEYRPVLFRNKTNSLSENILYPPQKKRKLSTTSEDSSVYTDDKYRELRDKNNEASRRSRMNRKSREVEMKIQAEELEATNSALKSKADELQRLVDRLRATLMEVMVRKC
nr:PREDICTED: uncharacterized protein LOC109040365 isoform X1 [Bemisia tabaci]